MVFLRLNEQTISIRRAREVPVEIGDRGRVLNGSYRNGVRTTKRKWMLETTQLNEQAYLALRALLLGFGHSWTFDVDLFSIKGLGPTVSTGATQLDTLASDLAVQVPLNGGQQYGGFVYLHPSINTEFN